MGSNKSPEVKVTVEVKKDRPVTQRVSMAYKNDFDDIDALISGINNEKDSGEFGMSTYSSKPETNTSTTVTVTTNNKANLDDIDDILADLSSNKSNTPSNKQSVQVRSSTTADLNAIDDLLADLTL